MSYILDALRRADAERERGAVPHLHTQAVPAAQPEADEAPAARPWGWLAAGLALGLLAALGWALGGGREAAPALTQAPAADGPAASVPTLAVPASATTERAPVATPGTPPVTPSIVPRSLPTAPSPADTRPETSAPATPPRAATAAATQRAAPASTPALSAPGTARSEPAVSPLAELPAEVRRELPQLTIGGSMYSQNAASRMLIVNGQLLREGDAVSPTVTLEQIKLRSAVLRYKTWRYEVGF